MQVAQEAFDRAVVEADTFELDGLIGGQTGPGLDDAATVVRLDHACKEVLSEMRGLEVEEPLRL